jgi:hypothetical protein
VAAGGQDNISIEMARLVELPKVEPPPPPLVQPISHHTVTWLVLTVFVLAFAGFCVMAFFVLWC